MICLPYQHQCKWQLQKLKGFSSEDLDFASDLIQAPVLYDASGSISSIPLAWSEWKHGSIACREGQANQS